MHQNPFTDKTHIPDFYDLASALGPTLGLWKQIRDYVFDQYPDAIEEWNFPGVKYGWSFRIKDKKRAILYLLPRNGYFMVAMVFGQSATDMILSSDIAEEIREEIRNAKPYAEGRGIRFAVRDESLVGDIGRLVKIKLK